jgi:hypothetical protein
MAASVAIADDIGQAHRHALRARDSYWNCLAEKHVSVNSRNMTAQEFALYVGGVCTSERQTFRVMLMHYLAMKFPSIDAGTHLATANNAIELAQKYIVTTFIRRLINRLAALGIGQKSWNFNQSLCAASSGRPPTSLRR